MTTGKSNGIAGSDVPRSRVDEVLRGIDLPRLALIACALILFVLYARLRLTDAATVREPRASFGDSADYLFIGSHSLFSAEFWFSDKPFLIPLLFKALGANFDAIFAVHLCFSILCWGILAAVCALVIRSYPLKFLAFAFVLGFSLSQQIILWDPLILSESVHFSLSALFYACGLLLCRRWNALTAGGLIALGALLTFARDTNAYMLLGAGLLLLFLALLIILLGRLRPPHGRSPEVRRLMLVAAAFIVIFAVSFTFSSAGGHPFPALMNLIGLRILPNPEYLAYFERQGMPTSAALLQYTGQAAHWDDLAMTQDPALVEFRTWVKDRGTAVLVGFLWHFKADTLQKPLGDLVAVLEPNLYYYSATGFRPILENTRYAEWLYPMRFGIVLFGAASMLAAFMAALALQLRKTMWLTPILMILLAYPQIVFVWNTDPNDVFRHALPLNVAWRLGFWLLMLLAADALLEAWIPRAREWSKRVWQRLRPATGDLRGREAGDDPDPAKPA